MRDDQGVVNGGSPVRRVMGIGFGLFVQGLFLVTVWQLFWFLRDGSNRVTAGGLWLDALLALQFAVVHSVLLWPPVRRRLGVWISPAFYGSVSCLATCVGLLILFADWSSSSWSLWDVNGSAKALIRFGFYVSWVALIYSLSLNGLGYQTGLTPWWYWLRRQPQPRRPFEIRGAYRLFRHPVYLSFLGLIWFTPRMSLDHLLLTAVWTVYIFVGSYLKDARLTHYLGKVYREYQSRVPGYPLVWYGPLGRRPWRDESETAAPATSSTGQPPRRNAA